MKLTRTQKEQLVREMTDELKTVKSAVLVNYQGLKVKEIWDLKKKLREQGIGFQIIKNTLFKIALKNSGIEITPELFDQPVAIVWGKTDEVIPAKVAVDFGKTAEKLKLIGAVQNQKFIGIEEVKIIAALPGREELYAKLVGTLNAPMSRLVNALQGNLRSLVYILKQYQEQKT